MSLNEIKTRLNCASIHDGRWAVEEDETWGAKVYVVEPGFGTMYICENLNQQDDGLADATFIANAPTDMARLIRAVEAVEELCVLMETHHDGTRRDVPLTAHPDAIRAMVADALGRAA